MSSSLSRDSDSAGHVSFYSRKDKSLGVLCSKFLKLYNKDGVETVGLDEAAYQLGVERRRIYDIVNILESVGVLARKAKNQYSWKGFGAIPQALQKLKDEGLRENFNTLECCSAETLNIVDEQGSSQKFLEQGDTSTSKSENRREKSLGLLTQNFLKLFLCSKEDVISLDNAAKALLGDIENSTAMRTKVRRLYDIANVLSSMDLIEKTQHPENKKPSLRWLGIRRQQKIGLLDVLNQGEHRRVFGTEITNNGSKRIKIDSSDGKNMKVLTKCGNLENEQDMDNIEQKKSSRNFEFGPFAPSSSQRVAASANKNMKHVQDLENLASTYRPEYTNQALNDLFVHYRDACKSWYDEVGKTKQIEPSEVIHHPSRAHPLDDGNMTHDA